MRVPVCGAAVLVVSLHPADITRSPAVPARTKLSTIRVVVGFDHYGGYLNYAVGVSDRNGFRVVELGNPTRLVIDIAHDLPALTSTELRASPSGDDRDANLTAIRTGTHPRYGRVVFDPAGPNAGLRHVVGYQDGALRVDLGRGTVRDATGSPTYGGPWTAASRAGAGRHDPDRERHDRTHHDPDHRAPHGGFRVLSLRSPDRIAVDIAH